MKLLTYLLLFLAPSVFAQSKDTSIVVKTPSSIIQLNSDYVVENGRIRPTSVSFSIQLRVNSDIVNEAMKKGVKSDEVVLDLIYDNNCNLKAYTLQNKSKVDAYNDWIPEYFEEFKEAFNSKGLKNFLSFFKDNPCGLGELELPIRVR